MNFTKCISSHNPKNEEEIYLKKYTPSVYMPSNTRNTFSTPVSDNKKKTSELFIKDNCELYNNFPNKSFKPYINPLNQYRKLEPYLFKKIKIEQDKFATDIEDDYNNNEYFRHNKTDRDYPSKGILYTKNQNQTDSLRAFIENITPKKLYEYGFDKNKKNFDSDISANNSIIQSKNTPMKENYDKIDWKKKLSQFCSQKVSAPTSQKNDEYSNSLNNYSKYTFDNSERKFIESINNMSEKNENNFDTVNSRRKCQGKMLEPERDYNKVNMNRIDRNKKLISKRLREGNNYENLYRTYIYNDKFDIGDDSMKMGVLNVTPLILKKNDIFCLKNRYSDTSSSQLNESVNSILNNTEVVGKKLKKHFSDIAKFFQSFRTLSASSQDGCTSEDNINENKNRSYKNREMIRTIPLEREKQSFQKQSQYLSNEKIFESAYKKLNIKQNDNLIFNINKEKPKLRDEGKKKEENISSMYLDDIPRNNKYRYNNYGKNVIMGNVEIRKQKRTFYNNKLKNRYLKSPRGSNKQNENNHLNIEKLRGIKTDISRNENNDESYNFSSSNFFYPKSAMTYCLYDRNNTNQETLIFNTNNTNLNNTNSCIFYTHRNTASNYLVNTPFIAQGKHVLNLKSNTVINTSNSKKKELNCYNKKCSIEQSNLQKSPSVKKTDSSPSRNEINKALDYNNGIKGMSVNLYSKNSSDFAIEVGCDKQSQLFNTNIDELNRTNAAPNLKKPKIESCIIRFDTYKSKKGNQEVPNTESSLVNNKEKESCCQESDCKMKKYIKKIIQKEQVQPSTLNTNNSDNIDFNIVKGTKKIYKKPNGNKTDSPVLEKYGENKIEDYCAPSPDYSNIKIDINNLGSSWNFVINDKNRNFIKGNISHLENSNNIIRSGKNNMFQDTNRDNINLDKNEPFKTTRTTYSNLYNSDENIPNIKYIPFNARSPKLYKQDKYKESEENPANFHSRNENSLYSKNIYNNLTENIPKNVNVYLKKFGAYNWNIHQTQQSPAISMEKINREDYIPKTDSTPFGVEGYITGMDMREHIKEKDKIRKIQRYTVNNNKSWFEKYYCFAARLPQHNGCFFTKKYIKTFRKPLLEINFLSKKFKRWKLPVSSITFFTKKYIPKVVTLPFSESSYMSKIFIDCKKYIENQLLKTERSSIIEINDLKINEKEASERTSQSETSIKLSLKNKIINKKKKIILINNNKNKYDSNIISKKNTPNITPYIIENEKENEIFDKKLEEEKYSIDPNKNTEIKGLLFKNQYYYEHSNSSRLIIDFKEKKINIKKINASENFEKDQKEGMNHVRNNELHKGDKIQENENIEISDLSSLSKKEKKVYIRKRRQKKKANRKEEEIELEGRTKQMNSDWRQIKGSIKKDNKKSQSKNKNQIFSPSDSRKHKKTVKSREYNIFESIENIKSRSIKKNKLEEEDTKTSTNTNTESIRNNVKILESSINNTPIKNKLTQENSPKNLSSMNLFKEYIKQKDIKKKDIIRIHVKEEKEKQKNEQKVLMDSFSDQKEEDEINISINNKSQASPEIINGTVSVNDSKLDESLNETKNKSMNLTMDKGRLEKLKIRTVIRIVHKVKNKKIFFVKAKKPNKKEKIKYKQNDKTMAEPKAKTKKSSINKILVSEKKKDLEKKILAILKEDLENFISFSIDNKKKIKLKKLGKKEKDNYDWSIMEQLMMKIKLDLLDIINAFLTSCIDLVDNKEKVLIAKEYIHNIIIHFKLHYINEDNYRSTHKKLITILNNIKDIKITSRFKYEILGGVFYALLINELFFAEDLDDFVNCEKEKQICIAKIIRYILLFCQNSRVATKYFEIFKMTKLFLSDEIYFKYVTRFLNSNFDE